MSSTNPLNVYTGPSSLKDYHDPELQPLLPLVEIPESLNPFAEHGVRIYAKMMTMLPAHNVKALPGQLAMFTPQSLFRLANTLSSEHAFEMRHARDEDHHRVQFWVHCTFNVHISENCTWSRRYSCIPEQQDKRSQDSIDAIFWPRHVRPRKHSRRPSFDRNPERFLGGHRSRSLWTSEVESRKRGCKRRSNRRLSIQISMKMMLYVETK